MGCWVGGGSRHCLLRSCPIAWEAETLERGPIVTRREQVPGNLLCMGASQLSIGVGLLW